MALWNPLWRAAVVRTTVETRPQAEALARRLVDARLAACVHVTEVASTYRWQGRVQQETEFLVEARTTPARRGDVEQAMLAGHPYEVPMVEVVGAYSWLSGAYARWMRGEVR